MALSGIEDIAFLVLVQHVPGLVTEAAQTSDAKPLSLAQRVVHQPGVFGDHRFIDRPDLAGAGRDVFTQEIFEIAFADETDSGAVLFVVNGQNGFFQQANVQPAFRSSPTGNRVRAS